METSIILLVLLTILFGTIDLGFGVFRYTVVSQGARQIARQAIVHGSMSTSGKWGPTTYSGLANGTDPIAAGAAPYLAGLDLSKTTVRIEWTAASNDPEQPVKVTVSSTYQPVTTFIFGKPTWTFTARSTMQVAH